LEFKLKERYGVEDEKITKELEVYMADKMKELSKEENEKVQNAKNAMVYSLIYS